MKSTINIHRWQNFFPDFFVTLVVCLETKVKKMCISWIEDFFIISRWFIVSMLKSTQFAKKDAYLPGNMFIHDQFYFGIQKSSMNGRKIYLILIKIWIMESLNWLSKKYCISYKIAMHVYRQNALLMLANNEVRTSLHPLRCDLMLESYSCF